MPDDPASPVPRKRLEAWTLATLPRATAYARSLLRDPTQADDVVHDCYCRILQKADRYDIPRDGTKILYRAITNACINLTRSRRLVRLEALGDEDRGFADPRALDPLDEILERELVGRVRACLDRLSVPQRAALELKSLGHTLQEIADALETTPTNAGVLVHRARQALAKHLGDREGLPS